MAIYQAREPLAGHVDRDWGADILTTGEVTMLQAALDYAEHGDPVFPVWWAANGRCACRTECQSPAKHPIASCAPNGLKDATTDAETIRRWWARFPKANIATRTGIRRTVLDIDTDAVGGRR